MREKMFRCLDEIGVFKYLSYVREYWTSDNKENLWEDLFTDKIEGKDSGIQLTQACNCAIIRGIRDSEQPSQSALNEITRIEPKCLFNRFHIGSSTKLIIFWGMSRRLDNYWRNSCFYEADVKTLVLPHPSGRTREYNNYALFEPFSDNDRTQLRNAKQSIADGKRIISELIKELNL